MTMPGPSQRQPLEEDRAPMTWELALELAHAPRVRHRHAPLDGPGGDLEEPTLALAAPPAAPPGARDELARARAWVNERRRGTSKGSGEAGAAGTVQAIRSRRAP